MAQKPPVIYIYRYTCIWYVHVDPHLYIYMAYTWVINHLLGGMHIQVAYSTTGMILNGMSWKIQWEWSLCLLRAEHWRALDTKQHVCSVNTRNVLCKQCKRTLSWCSFLLLRACNIYCFTSEHPLISDSMFATAICYRYLVLGCASHLLKISQVYNSCMTRI